MILRRRCVSAIGVGESRRRRSWRVPAGGAIGAGPRTIFRGRRRGSRRGVGCGLAWAPAFAGDSEGGARGIRRGRAGIRR